MPNANLRTLIAALLLLVIAGLFLAAPWLGSRATILMVTQAVILACFAMAYNVLLGQTGLLSFGPAVYFGIGAFSALYAVNGISSGQLPLPLELVPLLAGGAGLVAALVFGLISLRSGQIAFAMITMGLAELTHVFAMVFPSVFGGERGVSIDRMVDNTLTGWGYGRPDEIYWLVLFWAVLSIATLAWLTRTPLGRLANAVRDNEQRVAFLGYSPARIRYLQFALSGLFSGLAGGLFALTYEIANADIFGLQTSAGVLIAAYVGGIGSVFGPALGAIVVTLLEFRLARATEAWLLYYGLIFMGIVMFAPQGLWGLLTGVPTAIGREGFAVWLTQRLKGLALLLPGFVGGVLIVEMSSHRANAYDPHLPMHLLGLDAFSPLNWALALGLVAVSAALLLARRRQAGRRRRDGLPAGAALAGGAE